ncbi:MAG: beta/alpha barrel domain-containing protein [Ferrimicrobium sp.]|jgi:dihydroorotate dehydrogenase (NAD+) catalytic subunit|uniref:Dihydroorotate dehydrogenase n=1 Tax=Ferrimicrobium acidiphilum TaxID=121039 RepID=A0ABV3XZP0_9ACTN|nr:dihydroorotate dehydrogenase [Ferrimicrobium sp.]MCL5974162.1 dihydroorotate dehydrogenase [Actinomycetota bacterium]
MTPAADLSVDLGRLGLANPIMTAAGCGGYGVELSSVVDLSALGAHIVKSLAIFAHEGNPAPRLAPLPGGMLNSVGLPGPGVRAWLSEHYPRLVASGAVFGVSIWGRTVDEYAQAASVLATGAPEVALLELNISCPNTEAGERLFAHDPAATAAIVAGCRRVNDSPLFVKLSPNTDRYLEVASAALEAGADGLVAINTVFGQWFFDGRPALGTRRGGGLSGSQIHAIALRIVGELRQRFPGIAIVGVGGIANVDGVLRMLLAGADAVQVGTANFVDPRRSQLIVEQLSGYLRSRGVGVLRDWIDRQSRLDRSVPDGG